MLKPHREIRAERILNPFCPDHEAEQATPSHGWIVGIPSAQDGDLDGFLDVAFAVKQTDQAGADTVLSGIPGRYTCFSANA